LRPQGGAWQTGPKGVAERVAFYARHGLRAHSPAAFAFAVICVGLATLLRLLVDIVAPQAVPFATYFPAVLAATLIGGRTAGAVATLLSAVVSWYAFIPPRFVWTVITRPEAVSLILFVFASSTSSGSPTSTGACCAGSTRRSVTGRSSSTSSGIA
jgi:K+-sensing histidine kinase KdpD